MVLCTVNAQEDRALLYHTKEAQSKMSDDMKKAYATAKKTGGKTWKAFKEKADKGWVWTKEKGKYAWK